VCVCVCVYMSFYLLGELGLGHVGALLFESLLDAVQAGQDLRQLGAQPVDGAAPLHRLHHLTEEVLVD